MVGALPRSVFLVLVLLASFAGRLGAQSPAADYAVVEGIFAKHCLDCHAAQDPEGKLVLESFASLMKGGETGPALVGGKSDASLLVQMVEGRLEKNGKKKVMPPGKRKKLDPTEIAALKAWINAGATPPRDPARIAVRELVTPKIVPLAPPRRAIQAVAYEPGSKLIALARYGEVELRSAENRALVRTLPGHRGSVNALAFSADGKQLAAAAGEPGLSGEARLWNVVEGTLIRTFAGHRDALYAVALSPDGKTLATGSYDHKIKLWNVETGAERHTLSAHNGAVFDLAFRPDGKILASASGDRTVKLWEVASGKRVETLSQSLKELYAVSFSPDGQRLAAGGVDNRIRVWQISETAAETTNPILIAKFAHEGAILNLLYSSDGKTLLSSADDGTVKLWEAATITEKLLLEPQPDQAPALAFANENKAIVVGRLDGTLEIYDAASGQRVPLPAPEISRIEPRGIQRGTTLTVKLIGKHLMALTNATASHPKLTSELLSPASGRADEASIRLTATSDLPRGAYEVSVMAPGGTGKIMLQVDDLPQVYQPGRTNLAAWQTVSPLPASFWGTLETPGDEDSFRFPAQAGQMIVFDLAAKSLGSKIATPSLTVTDENGAVLAGNSGFDGGDPLLAYQIPRDGVYAIRVSDQTLGASVDHFYRLSAGALPYVTGIFPLAVVTNQDAVVQLIGYNLPRGAKQALRSGAAGEMDVPLDANQFRSRSGFKLLVSEGAEWIESEPNDRPEVANRISAPGGVSGRIWAANGRGDVDIYRFEAKAGQAWIIETMAAQRGCPTDTRIELLQADGQPVPRLLLQAVRNSAVTFRGIGSDAVDCRLENWEEMELNDLLYLQGEVAKLWRAPQGPDSGFVFYSGAGGKRRCFFDTSGTVHASGEACYIVEPHPPGAKLVANGLPVFPLFYANDDDGDRQLGSDSRLHFSTPKDGSYLVRVTDTRGYDGERFAYRLVIREARPDFKVTLNGAGQTIDAGSGRAFSVTADRLDGFDGEIKVDLQGLPPGFSVSTPLVIQAGQTEAKGTIHGALDALQPNETNGVASKVTATAMVNGKPISKEVNNLGQLKLGVKPKLFVALEPPGVSSRTNASAVHVPLELTIVPGQAISAWLKVTRNGHDDLVTFTVENLPHGIIVDNIGLNGVLIPKGQDEREIFLTAAKWVPETDRLCYAVENQAGRQTSLPVLLHVRKSGSKVVSAAK